MAIVRIEIDPDAVAYTDDEIVGKINAATAKISRAESVEAAARPIEDAEVSAPKLADDAAKLNLDAMVDTERGYVNTAPITGEKKVISVQVTTNNKLGFDCDDVPIP